MGLLATFASVSAGIQDFLSVGLLVAIGLGAIGFWFRFLVGVVDFMKNPSWPRPWEGSGEVSNGNYFGGWEWPDAGSSDGDSCDSGGDGGGDCGGFD